MSKEENTEKFLELVLELARRTDYDQWMKFHWAARMVQQKDGPLEFIA
jgi:hypothetical protein